MQVPLAGGPSKVHAGPTASNADTQSFGGPPPTPSRHTYQSRFGSSREERAASNHGWRSDVWFGTQSSTTRMSRVAALDEPVEVLERAEQRIDVAVVGDVIAEVGHGGGEDRRQPHRFHPQVAQVVDPRHELAQVADAVTVGVGERARIDDRDRAALPPGRSGRPEAGRRMLAWASGRARPRRR